MKKFDLHTHSRYSDGINTPEEIVRYAKAIGLDGIAVTDHDSVKGLKEAEKIAKEVKIMLVPGVEITTHAGDILALNVSEVFHGSPLEIIDKIHSAGGIAILAHPFIGLTHDSLINSKEALKKIDAIEIFNAFTPLEYNIQAMEFANRFGIAGVAGSDAHFLEAVGTAFTISKDKKILEAIKKGNVKIGWL
ncbi:MAG: CehA/McbA family metallohydrolase [Candidatus Aenigmatarchaeota archaeon]